MIKKYKNTKEIVCPYCGYEYDDSYEYEQHGGTTICESCEKTFEYSVHHSRTYSTEKQ
jgi:transcription elongation factor Elf1